MEKTTAFVGIDAGTTGCTVMIFDGSGRSLGHGYQEYPCIAPHPGWSEQDLDAVWQGICQACSQATSAANLPAEAYKSVGLSSQRGTVAMLDGDKQPLCNSYVWNCTRAIDYQAKFEARISRWISRSLRRSRKRRCWRSSTRAARQEPARGVRAVENG